MERHLLLDCVLKLDWEAERCRSCAWPERKRNESSELSYDLSILVASFAFFVPLAVIDSASTANMLFRYVAEVMYLFEEWERWYSFLFTRACAIRQIYRQELSLDSIYFVIPRVLILAQI